MSTISQEEVISAYRTHYKLGLVKYLALISLGLLIIFGAIIAFDLTTGFVLLLLGSGIIGGLIGHYWFFPMKVKKIYKEQKDLQLTFELTWDSECVAWTSLYGDAKIPWRDFVKYKEGPDVILLYRSRVLFQMIPKSIFSSLEELNEFKTHFNRIGR